MTETVTLIRCFHIFIYACKRLFLLREFVQISDSSYCISMNIRIMNQKRYLRQFFSYSLDGNTVWKVR